MAGQRRRGRTGLAFRRQRLLHIVQRITHQHAHPLGSRMDAILEEEARVFENAFEPEWHQPGAIFARERFSVGNDEIEAIIAAVQENTEA